MKKTKDKVKSKIICVGKPKCKHDWNYGVGESGLMKACIKCGRIEYESAEEIDKFIERNK